MLVKFFIIVYKINFTLQLNIFMKYKKYIKVSKIIFLSSLFIN